MTCYYFDSETDRPVHGRCFPNNFGNIKLRLDRETIHLCQGHARKWAKIIAQNSGLAQGVHLDYFALVGDHNANTR
jgi:hypothetical protein